MAALSGLARETRQEPATRPPRPGGAMDWGDVRVFLAVAREGSMRAAGRALGLSQPRTGEEVLPKACGPRRRGRCVSTASTRAAHRSDALSSFVIASPLR